MKNNILRKLLLITLLLLIGAYTLLPGALQWGLERLLRDQGYDQVSLANVDLEPFAGEVHLYGLKAQRGDSPPLALDSGYVNLDWLALTRRQGLLQGLAIGGLQLTLQQGADGQLILSGLPLPADQADADKQPITWGFGIDRLSVTDSQLRLQLADVDRTIKVEQLLLTGLRSWDADTPAQLQLAARLNGALLRIDGQLLPFAEAPLVNTRLRIDDLDLAQLAQDLGKQLPPNVQLPAGTLSADLQLQAGISNGQPQLSPQGSLSLRGLQLVVDDQPQAIGQLDWNGKLNWSKQDGVASDGSLAVRDAALGHGGRELRLAALDWQGEAGWSAATGPSAAGSLTAADLKVTQPAQQLLLAELTQLQVPVLRLGEQLTVELDEVSIDGPVALQALDTADSPPLFRAARLQLGPSRIQGTDAIALGELNITDTAIDIVRDGNGKLALIERMNSGATAEPAASDAGTTPGPSVALAGLRLSGNSQLSFNDHSVQPSFRQRLDIDQLVIGALDSAAAGQWTPVELAGRLGEYSRLSLTGKARPFADQVNVDLTGTLKAVDLPPLSSYTAAQLGYNLQSGQLDSDITLKITDDQLDGNAKLVLNKLNVKAADAERMAQLTRELSMPLDSALNMLRDGDDNIRLTLPVSGDIHKPDFDLSNIINKAMGSALRSAALSYVKYALQPYGALITLAQIAGKAASRVALDPLAFPAGSSDPAADAGPYLDKLTGLLKDRPALRFQICGLATEADRQALAAAAAAQAAAQPAKDGETKPAPAAAPVIADDQLLKLAEERAAAIKRQLVDRGAAPERLFVCNPEIDKAADAKPRADLLL